MHRFSRAILAGLWVASMLTVPVAAQPRPTGLADVVINMRDIELSAVAEQISRITGRTLVLDPSVKGTVNVVSAEPLTPDGVWDLFLSVLRVHGYGAVRSGAAWRIVPQAAAVQGSGAVSARAARPQELVTSLIPLRNLPSDAAVRVFRPLIPPFASLEALARPNAIVITDYAENVRRIEALARSLDGGGSAASSFGAITLKYASAATVAEAIRRILGEEAVGGPSIAVDERSNMLLIRTSPASLAEARQMAVVLDVPSGTAPSTRVFRLSNSDAETVTEVLRGLMGSPAQANNPVARSLQPGGSSSQSRLGRPSQTPSVAQAAAGITPASTGATLATPAADAASRPAVAGFTVDDVAVQAAPELNAIVVRGPPTTIDMLGQLIAQLDVRRPQVLIEAAIVEITGEQAEQLGIQLGSGGLVANEAAAGLTSFSNAGVPLASVLQALGSPVAGNLSEGLTLGGTGRDFSILVQALSQSTRANLLSTPSLTTLDNEAAEIVVGQNVPFRTGSFTTQGNSTNPFTTIERQDVGITLRVVPRVHDGDVVRLEVSQEVSSLANGNAGVIGAADLITNRRSIQTTVLADNGQVIVLGGLITDDRLSSKGQVPLLGDIPVLGSLFRSERESATKRTLFVFLRPTILRTKESVGTATREKYDRLQRQEQLQGDKNSLLLAPPDRRLPPDSSQVLNPPLPASNQ